MANDSEVKVANPAAYAMALFYWQILKESDEELNNDGGFAGGRKLSILTRIFGRDPTKQEGELLDDLFGEWQRFPFSIQGAAANNNVAVEDVLAVLELFFGGLASGLPKQFDGMREAWRDDAMCGECEVKISELHDDRCDLEECPFCHGRMRTCDCRYEKLQLGYGGRNEAYWQDYHRQTDIPRPPVEQRKSFRPLTSLEWRQWEALVTEKGPIPFGSEQRYQ